VLNYFVYYGEFERMTKVRDQKVITKFGERIKYLRETKSLSQEDLAYAADIPVNQVGRIERGEINTTISSLYAIAKALGLKPKELLDF
jgi:transcriptional regulator with XRE-family HTH domain